MRVILVMVLVVLVVVLVVLVVVLVVLVAPVSTSSLLFLGLYTHSTV